MQDEDMKKLKEYIENLYKESKDAMLQEVKEDGLTKIIDALNKIEVHLRDMTQLIQRAYEKSEEYYIKKRDFWDDLKDSLNANIQSAISKEFSHINWENLTDEAIELLLKDIANLMRKKNMIEKYLSEQGMYKITESMKKESE